MSKVKCRMKDEARKPMRPIRALAFRHSFDIWFSSFVILLLTPADSRVNRGRAPTPYLHMSAAFVRRWQYSPRAARHAAAIAVLAPNSRGSDAAKDASEP